MTAPERAKAKVLYGITDLTLMAPIRRGLIPALDARGYASRLRAVLATLNGFRQSSVEVTPVPLIQDAIDRIRAVHGFRVALVEPDQVLLSVSFDGGWEPYMRQIWRDLGPFLDLIFCHAEGYLTSHDHGYEDYIAWVRRVQVPTEFYYEAAPVSVNDLHYLRRAAGGVDVQGGATVVRPAEYYAQARPALTALYRLVDWFGPPDAAGCDGHVLHRAARRLLADLVDRLPVPGAGVTLQPIEAAALAWFRQPTPAAAGQPPRRPWRPANVQGGIVEPYRGITHGGLLLLGLSGPAAAAALIAAIEQRLVSAADQATTGRTVYFNLAFTWEGLQVAGVPPATLAQMPQEFKEGMAARYSVLGDVLHNHPSRWTLPERHDAAADAPQRVDLSTVHAVVHCSGIDHGVGGGWDRLTPDTTVLKDAVASLLAACGGQGVRLLAQQPMWRMPAAQLGLSQGHFGYVDGISQPRIAVPGGAAVGAGYTDAVEDGDLLLGCRNSLGDDQRRGPLWDDSTFLVVRKLRQDVPAFEGLAQDVAGAAGVSSGQAKALLMGRAPDGTPLVHPPGPPPAPAAVPTNAFDYGADPHGQRCPFQSHVRRANPRALRDDLQRVPRLWRRGMSYGPAALPGQDDGVDRGLVFMAYNASIAEQFEVIQAWLSGGVSSAGADSWSALRDPLLGVVRPGDPAVFRCTGTAGAAVSVPLPTGARPLVTLQWGLYLFVPALAALAHLRALAEEADRAGAAPPDDAARQQRERLALQQLAQTGAVLIERLRRVESLRGMQEAAAQWKLALEDSTARLSGASQAIWAAVRVLHGGVLRTPYGVLVGSVDAVQAVFDNVGARYSVSGYAERMQQSFGEIYLGRDEGPAYRRVADPVNRAIQGISRGAAFAAAYACMGRVVAGLGAASLSRPVDLEVRDLVDGLLAELSAYWFGIPDGQQVRAGGWQWSRQEAAGPVGAAATPPTCPGHFHAPSRYMFQPHPGAVAADTGRRHGQELLQAVQTLLAAHAAGRPNPWTAPLAPSRPIVDAILAVPGSSVAEQASTLIGVMMGFLPTVDGNLRGLLFEWVRERTLWQAQLAWRGDATADRLRRAEQQLQEPLVATLQRCPVPELVWRTALQAHDLFGTAVQPGDRMVVAIVSALQARQLAGDPDRSALFGGLRAGHPPSPQHACPGQEMAMGVMLGALAALMDAGDWLTAASPLALRLA